MTVGFPKEKHIFLSIFLVFSIFFFSNSALALTYSGYSDKLLYAINETIVYRGTLDTNISANVSLYLLSSSGASYNSTIVFVNSLNFTTNLTASITSSGSYSIKSNFTYNSTYYESSTGIKISSASKISITTNKAVLSPGETFHFKVKATNANDAAISDESIQVKLTYLNNDTNIANTSGTTDASGLFSSNFLAPNSSGTYRLIVNDGAGVKLLDVSTFDLVAFSGDVNANTKFRFGINDTAYIYVDLFTPNKTRYSPEGTETVNVNITYLNDTVNTATLSYSGSRVNTSYVLNQSGTYSVKVSISSVSRSLSFTLKVESYELRAALSASRGDTTSFFPNETVTVTAKVFNISSGEQITSNLSSGVWNLTIFDSGMNPVSNVSNSTVRQPDSSYKFYFNVSTSGIYYLEIRLNQSSVSIGFDVKGNMAEAIAVDQDYNLKNMFVGNKQTIRILTSLSNSSGSMNVTNVSVVDVTTWDGTSVKSNFTFNNSIIDHKGNRVGLTEFSAPADAGWYYIMTKANSLYEGETWFLIKLYSACAQLSGNKWFASSSEDVSLSVKVSEAKDIGFIEGVAGNTSSSGSGNATSLYGMMDCYASYTTVSGSSTTGNTSSNVQVSVSKVINTQTMEDVTSKISSLPTGTTDNNGNVSLVISKPSGGWDGGSYIVELSLRDRNNNTDKGFGSFQVRNLWINVWPKQYSGYWKWFFSPTENLTFDVYSYNATQSWSYTQGTGDNCYVISVGYQGTGSEWFWPPKTIDSSKYNWTCANTSSPANGRFTLAINHTESFKSGYYVVRVKVNTTTNISDVGDGWFSVKAYNVYVRTSSSNYYDSWYKSPTDNLTFVIDVTNASSTSYSCYWSSCPSSELAREQLNITVKGMQKYNQWPPQDYSRTKYNASFAGNTTTTTSNYTLTTFNDSTTSKNLTLTNVSTSTTTTTSNTTIQNYTLTTFNDSSIIKNITLSNVSTSNITTTTNTTTTQNYTLTTFNDSSITKNITLSNVSTTSSTNITIGTFNDSTTIKNISLNAAGSNTSAWINMPKNVTANSTAIRVGSDSTISGSLSLFSNTSNYVFFSFNNFVGNDIATFSSNLTTVLSSCVAVSNNCTLGINVTLNSSGTVQLSNLIVSYLQNQTSASITNSSTWINMPKNATIVNATVNVTANATLNITLRFDNFLEIFSGVINTTQTNITFSSTLTSRLSSCTAVANNCTLGFNITSNTTGILNMSSLSISYQINQTTTNTTNTTLYTSTNSSTWINMPKNATIVNATMNVTANATLTNVSIRLNNITFFSGTINTTQVNLTFASSLTTVLSSCVAVSNNCTLGINVTANATATENATGIVTLSNISINYQINQTTNTTNTTTTYSITNTSALIGLPRNATIVNATMNVTANATINVTIRFNASTEFFSGVINTTQTNVSFASALTSRLSSCTAESSGNCTIGFNITANETAIVTLSNISISYTLNQTTNSTSYWSVNTTSGTATFTLTPLAGTGNNSWETGYYNVIIEVNGSQGTESSSAWFEVRKFFVDVTPVNAAGTQSVYSFRSSQNITLNISAISKPGWMRSYYGVGVTYYNATIVDMKLNYYSYTDYKTRTIPVNWSSNSAGGSSNVNGTSTVNVTPSTALSGGNWYWMDITLRDNEGNNQTGYASFQIKDFSFSAQTSNWRWEFNTTEPILINAYVCDADQWWCSDSTSYTGSAAVNVSVSKLYKTTNWPYTSVTTYTATSNQTSGSNSGRTKITITPNPSLSSGYYMAELTSRYADGSGSIQTTNVWFNVKTFTLSAYATKWEFAMRENVTIAVTASKNVNISNVNLNCGNWPNQKQYTYGSNINVNTTTITSGITNHIKLFPVNDRWANGYCWGYITASDGDSTQDAYISFSVRAFALTASTTKYSYQKNESVVLQLTTDSGQQLNISSLNVSIWDSNTYNYTVLSYSNSNSSLNLTLNRTNFTSQGSISITPPTGNWTLFGWYNGQLEVIDSQDPNIRSTAWFWFSIPQPLYGYGWPIDTSGNYQNIYTTTQNISFRAYAYRLTSISSYWANYASANNVKINITNIEKENCNIWPCTRTTVTGYNSFNSTTNSNGIAYVNISKSDGWSSGSYRVSLLLNDTANNLVDTTSSMWFWVSY